MMNLNLYLWMNGSVNDMARLIDADVAEKLLREYADDVGCNRGEYELANGILKAVSYIRHNIPTAYDVEKVVGEIEEDKFKHPFDEDEKIINSYIDRAIKAVRKGGVE